MTSLHGRRKKRYRGAIHHGIITGTFSTAPGEPWRKKTFPNSRRKSAKEDSRPPASPLAEFAMLRDR
eukprot:3026252-Prorocentrum_lima.AAC.1